jgi:hypothetical protein
LDASCWRKKPDAFQLSVKKMLADSNGDLKQIANEYGYGRTMICSRPSAMARPCRVM